MRETRKRETCYPKAFQGNTDSIVVRLNQRFPGIAIIYTPRRFYIFMRRTTISHF